MIQDITIQQAKALPSVSSEESHLKIRLNPTIYPHYCKVSLEKRLQSLKLILLACYAIKHQSDTSFLASDASILDQMILQHSQYRELTLNEINKALTNGSGGLYGEGYLTPEYCMKWLGKFISENEGVYLEAKRRRTANASSVTKEDIIRKYAYMMAQNKLNKK